MKYTIISLNEDRAAYKQLIRQRVGLEELLLPSVDGRAGGIQKELESRGLHSIWDNAKVGELGVWCSNFDRWLWAAENNEALVVFEDDAIPAVHFNDALQALVEDLPPDWDFVSLWVPENQRIDYEYELVYNEIGDPVIFGRRPYGQSLFKHTFQLAHVYQGYGMVAMAYSPAGARRLVDHSKEYGATCPVDCWIYQQAHKGILNGFAPAPLFANLVEYDWAAPSHVQQTERA